MNHRRCLSLLLGLGWLAAPGAAEPTPARPGLLVELFTSQGCSSCPPADRLLPELQASVGDAAGVELVPLSFHVDYWNRLGWRDPFSDEAFSVRQRQYAAWFEEDRVYTPQLVLAGREHCVGSDLECIERSVAGLASEPTPRIALTAEQSSDGIEVEVAVHGVESTERLLVWGLLRQRGLETRVTRGENARRTLHNDFVVRRIVVLGQTEAGQSSGRFRHSLERDPSWGRESVDVVVFLQDPSDGSVHGAAQVEAR